MIKKTQKDEILERGLYDFICNHYWEMTKEDMAELIKEFWYAVYEMDGKNTVKLLEEKMFDEIELAEEQEV